MKKKFLNPKFSRTTTLLTGLVAGLVVPGLAQVGNETPTERETETKVTPAKLAFSGYLEAYYSYDFAQPRDNTRPGFVYSHNRHNEINVNLGFLRATYTDERVRGNLALMVGTYANANLAGEPGVLRNIFEANAGVKISAKKNLWVDAGVFASHIGFESAISKDCWNLTRSILADNTPYYESGAKITYTTDDGQWYLSGMVLNGWQQMRRPDGNRRLALGTQLTYKPSGRVTLNWSTFAGSALDTTNRNRYFSNLYGIFQLTDKFGLIGGFDYGVQQRATGDATYHNWTSLALILRYQVSNKVTLAGRVENYTDRNGVVIGTGTRNGFNTNGYSLNLDVAPVPNAVWRIEGRLLSSQDAVFAERNGNASQTNAFVTTSLALSF